jgi:hypothetical protein
MLLKLDKEMLLWLLADTLLADALLELLPLLGVVELILLTLL